MSKISRSEPPKRDVPRHVRCSHTSNSARAVATILLFAIIICSFVAAVIIDLIPSKCSTTTTTLIWPSAVGAIHINSTTNLSTSTALQLSPSDIVHTLRGQQGTGDIYNSTNNNNNTNLSISTVNGTNEPKNNVGKPIIIGFLTNIYGRHNPIRQGLVISGAISYAIDVVNKERPNLLKGRPLQLLYNDTSGTAINGTAALISQWRAGAVAFFGPEDTCDVEATLAAALNLPMISYKCANTAVSDKVNFPTFARTHPPDEIVVQSVIALLQFFQWKKFAIVWQINKHEAVVSSLRKSAKMKNLTVTVEHAFVDDYTCCSDRKPCCGKMWSETIDKTYRDARIYVFLGGGRWLSYFLLALKSRGFFDNGDYVVISVELDEDLIQGQAYRMINQRTDILEHELNEIREAVRSCLIIARSPPESPNYDKFVEKVREYNKRPPFSYTDHLDLKRHITYYAAYLYDSVILYAETLSKMFEDGLNEHDGREIIRRIIKRQNYQSVTGAWMHIDQNGDVQGNYTVLQVSQIGRNITTRSVNGLVSNKSDSSLGIVMSQVGTFVIENTNVTKFSQSLMIDWVRPGHVPSDEPPCGFDGKDCTKRDVRLREILTGILTAVFIIFVACISLAYRSWKYEQEIDGLLWKIPYKELTLVGDRPKGISASRVSLISNNSIAQDRINNIGAETWEYKGALVTLKEFTFNKVKKNSGSNPFDNLSREDKKEMKYMKSYLHRNINPFIGASFDPERPSSVVIVSEFCVKGSLKDIIENKELKLEDHFVASLVYGILSGIAYLHKSEIKCHGNLKTTNCLVTSRWMLKLTDFGLHKLRTIAETDSTNEDQCHFSMLWKAPEILRGEMRASPEADIYAFGIIFHELVARKGPYSIVEMVEELSNCKSFTAADENEAAKKILDLVKEPSYPGNEFRPNIENIELNNELLDILKSCWEEDPRSRPMIETLRMRFKSSHAFKPPAGNIVDNMMKMMEVYQTQLEDLVDKRTSQLNDEKKRVVTLLHRMLPESVAKQLLQGNNVQPESFDAVTIFFSDIVGFTSLSASSEPMEVVTFLNDLYTLFDSIISHYDVYKVETIGDAYMVVSGLPIRNQEKHCTEIASMALEMLESIRSFKIHHRPNEMLQLRIGIHTGPVVAGVVGSKMPRYCLFGDTVNTASRMESNGQALKIHISPECRDHLEPTKKYIIEERGLVSMKGKGEICTYWLLGHVDGPQPRLRNLDDVEAHFPSRNKDKTRPQITFLGDEIMSGDGDCGAASTSRKGSLVTFDKFSHISKKPSRSLVNSILRLKGGYSNSCNTVSNGGREVRASPKPAKRNWNFKLFNGKIRSMSNHRPDEGQASNSSGNQTNQAIAMKETKPPKGIIKSPSYNTIETYSQQRRDSELMSDYDSDSSFSGIRARIGRSQCEKGPPVDEQTEKSFNTNQLPQYRSDLEFNDEYSEDRPLLGKCSIHRLGGNNKSITRQISLAEEDEEMEDSSPIAGIVQRLDEIGELEKRREADRTILQTDCDTYSSDKHVTSPLNASAPPVDTNQLNVGMATTNGDHKHLDSNHQLSSSSSVTEFVCLQITPNNADTYYYDNHLVNTTTATSAVNGIGVKINGSV
ncbi:hypothetical protein RDWZM_000843 [Blomia tropicalis]|uniref:Guanylate cyclase n=1 Tax=Blomia tropicalis TaxID=40697 RepID=A0A9Q0MBP9_BLOTA|nr:hypothetical protein RDWZM_000843 [Blomia tropicalis]